MPNKIFYTYDQMIQGVNYISRQMSQENWRPDYVVGLLRGGIIPAVHLSHWWDIPLIALPWSTRDGKTSETKNIQPISDLILSRKKVLVVDDICDSALTLDQVTQSTYQKVGAVNYDSDFYRTAVLHHNIGQDIFEPSYYHIEINKTEDPSWIVYPWEIL